MKFNIIYADPLSRYRDNGSYSEEKIIPKFEEEYHRFTISLLKLRDNRLAPRFIVNNKIAE